MERPPLDWEPLAVQICLRPPQNQQAKRTRNRALHPINKPAKQRMDGVMHKTIGSHQSTEERMCGYLFTINPLATPRGTVSRRHHHSCRGFFVNKSSKRSICWRNKELLICCDLRLCKFSAEAVVANNTFSDRKVPSSSQLSRRRSILPGFSATWWLSWSTCQTAWAKMATEYLKPPPRKLWANYYFPKHPGPWNILNP